MRRLCRCFSRNCFDVYVLCNFLICIFCFFLHFVTQIRNVCGTKSQSNSSIDTIDEQKRCEPNANHSDIYLAQLKNFIAKNSHESFKCKRYQTRSIQIAETHHNHRSTVLTNDLVSVNQSTDLGRKCKRFVYKFMKGLLDERTFKNGKIFKEEPIYFEVRFSVDCKKSKSFLKKAIMDFIIIYYYYSKEGKIIINSILKTVR